MLLVADNIQITNSTIAHALSEMDPTPIQQLAKRCEAAGAQAVDINTGPLGRHPEEKMTFFVNTVQKVTDIPVLLDTANPQAMKAGLIANEKTAIINGFSLQPEKIKDILPLAKEFDTDIVGYLLNHDGHVPHNAAERLSAAIEIYRHIQSIGIDSSRLIIDPIIVPLTWQNGTFQAAEVLTVIRQLSDVLGFPVRTIVGLSNLTSGLTSGKANMKKKILLERTYLSMLSAENLSMVLLNIFHAETIETARVCNILQGNNVFAWDEIP